MFLRKIIGRSAAAFRAGGAGRLEASEEVPLDSRPTLKPHPPFLTLPLRKFAPALDPDKVQTEMDCSYSIELRRIDLASACLVVIDAWKYHPNAGWLARVKAHQEAKLKPMLELIRKHGVHLVHASHGQEISPLAAPRPGEFVAEFTPNSFDITRDALRNHLESRGIRSLFYAGYASNWCVLHRPTGIIAMAKAGYDIILIRDCTIAFETPDTLSGEWCNYVTVNTVEHQWGATVTLSDLQAAFQTQSG
jgi:nicotinamidase-related amidase